MHYYKRNIGDYAKKAARLTILQHGVYNLLIDACYDRERFPTREEAIDWTWASTPEEAQAVDFVLRKFFVLDEKTGVYVQARIAEEIAEYQEFCEGQAENGKKGGRPKKAKPSDKKPDGFSEEPKANPNETERGQKQTLTTNQEPLTTNQLKEMFASIWDSWPVGLGEKGARKPAEAAFLKIKPDRVLFAEMLRAVDAQARDKASKRASNQFTPPFQNVERWLKNQRWTDEITSNAVVAPKAGITDKLTDRSWAEGLTQ